MRKFLLICVLSVLPTTCLADGHLQFARKLNQHRRLYHDRTYNGAEVVYRSSGTATRQGAIQAWLNSPPHRALLQAGKIRNIVCHGNVCVGR